MELEEAFRLACQRRDEGLAIHGQWQPGGGGLVPLWSGVVGAQCGFQMARGTGEHIGDHGLKS